MGKFYGNIKTIGDLKEAIKDLPDHMPIFYHNDATEEAREHYNINFWMMEDTFNRAIIPRLNFLSGDCDYIEGYLPTEQGDFRGIRIE